MFTEEYSVFPITFDCIIFLSFQDLWIYLQYDKFMLNDFALLCKMTVDLLDT